MAARLKHQMLQKPQFILWSYDCHRLPWPSFWNRFLRTPYHTIEAVNDCDVIYRFYCVNHTFTIGTNGQQAAKYTATHKKQFNRYLHLNANDFGFYAILFYTFHIFAHIVKPQETDCYAVYTTKATSRIKRLLLWESTALPPLLCCRQPRFPSRLCSFTANCKPKCKHLFF